MKKAYYIILDGEPTSYCGGNYKPYLVTAASDATEENVMQTVTGEKEGGIFGPDDDNKWIEDFVTKEVEWMEEMSINEENKWLERLSKNWGIDLSDLSYLCGNIDYSKKITLLQPKDWESTSIQIPTKILREKRFIGEGYTSFTHDGKISCQTFRTDKFVHAHWDVEIVKSFNSEYEKIISSLSHSEIFSNIVSFWNFLLESSKCSRNPHKSEPEYGFKIETRKNLYLVKLRNNTQNNKYGFTCYCYRKL